MPTKKKIEDIENDDIENDDIENDDIENDDNESEELTPWQKKIEQSLENLSQMFSNQKDERVQQVPVPKQPEPEPEPEPQPEPQPKSPTQEQTKKSFWGWLM